MTLNGHVEQPVFIVMSEIIKLNNPFKRTDRQVMEVQPGLTLAQIRCRPEIIDTMPIANDDIIMVVNGEIINKERWATYIIKPFDFVLVVPRLGKGQKEKQVMNIAAMVAVMYFTAGWLGPMEAWGLVEFGAFVAVVAGAGMLIQSLTPYPDAPSPAFNSAELSQSYGWEPATVHRQGGAVPRFYGKNKMFGNIITSHTEVTGDTTNLQYQYLLACLGVGPFREPVIDGTLKLNDQLITNFDDVSYEERQGLLRQTYISYFEETRHETDKCFRLVVNGSPIIYETKHAKFDDIEIDLSFPNGLWDGTGPAIANHTVNITIEIKKTTSSTWMILADGVNITAGTVNKVIRTYTTVDTINIDRGSNYQIRVTKNTAEKDSVQWGDDLYIDRVRTITDEPFTYPRRALVGVKALATDQLSGSIRFSCYSRCLYLRDFDGNIEYSTNPSRVIADILTQPIISGDGDGAPFAIERYDGYNVTDLDTSSFEELEEWCDEIKTNSKNFTISAISQAADAIITTTSEHDIEVDDLILFRGVDNHEMVEITDGTTATVLSVADATHFTIDLDTSGYTAFDAVSWLGVNSANLHDHCGFSAGNTLAEALNGTDYWEHLVNEDHYFIIDLGQIYDVRRIRGRSGWLDDPIDIDIYVHETEHDVAGAWGAAVASEITTWQDNINYVTINSTDKDGRYILVKILDTEDAGRNLSFGRPVAPYSIFDVEVLQSTATVEKVVRRFEINGGFDTEGSLWPSVLKMCGLCRCIPWWKGDKIALAINKSKTATYAFTPGNTSALTFKELFVPTAERASQIEVHYRDKEEDFDRQPFTLMNPNIENPQQKVRLDLFGITSKSMAEYLANFKLLENQYIERIVSIDADIDAITCSIGDVVLVMSDITDWGGMSEGDEDFIGGGRIVMATNDGNAVITIKGKLRFNDADWKGGSTVYKLMIKTSDDHAPETKTITAYNDGTNKITVSGTYTGCPQEHDIWAAGVENLETKKFRIVNLQQDSDQRVKITAMEYNELVYADD